MTITTRAGRGSELTWAEVDANFTSLDITDETSFPGKTTPVDADKLAMRDSVSGTGRLLTWANLKATLKTYFDSVAQTLTNKTLTAPVITLPTGIVKADVGLANADNTSDASKPVSAAQQTALDMKANLASPTFTGTVSGVTKAMIGLGNVDNTADAAKSVSYAATAGSVFAQTLLDDTTAAEARTTLGAAASAELAASSGASLVGYLPADIGAVATTVLERLRLHDKTLVIAESAGAETAAFAAGALFVLRTDLLSTTTTTAPTTTTAAPTTTTTAPTTTTTVNPSLLLTDLFNDSVIDTTSFAVITSNGGTVIESTNGATINSPTGTSTAALAYKQPFQYVVNRRYSTRFVALNSPSGYSLATIEAASVPGGITSPTFDTDSRLRVGMDLTGVLLGYVNTSGAVAWAVNNIGTKSWALNDEFEYVIETTPTTWRMTMSRLTGGTVLVADTGALAWSLIKGNPATSGVNQWLVIGDNNTEGTDCQLRLTKFMVENY